ncbi:hypothetical protein CTL2C_559 [Chlamydia trachomatis L2c]|nr:hypothetical protein CTL2C_559 [Chlamydia trachomatis L2c]
MRKRVNFVPLVVNPPLSGKALVCNSVYGAWASALGMRREQRSL